MWSRDEVSVEWIYELLENYPDHVIEFNCFTEPWGTLPGYNVVFWEGRSY